MTEGSQVKKDRESVIIGSVFEKNGALNVVLRAQYDAATKKETPIKYELFSGQTIHLSQAKDSEARTAKIAAGKKMPWGFAMVYVDEQK
jgi:hypothetical protein